MERDFCAAIRCTKSLARELNSIQTPKRVFPEPLAPMITKLDWDRTFTESSELEIDGGSCSIRDSEQLTLACIAILKCIYNLIISC
ncbi:MAG: hypothetical protein DWQ53_21020 [Microcystis flos-aquae DF17]|nr:MAG: hypothetical protein DWQ53_21020 [Microcystis flos-aquae DF17]